MSPVVTPATYGPDRNRGGGSVMGGMGIAYENTRINFDNIVKRYEEYKALYKMINNGSLEGLTSFDQFYWRMTYYSRYQDRKNYGTAGY